MKRHHDQENLQKKVFNLGTHGSRGCRIESMTIMEGSMASGRHGAELRAW